MVCDILVEVSFCICISFCFTGNKQTVVPYASSFCDFESQRSETKSLCDIKE